MAAFGIEGATVNTTAGTATGTTAVAIGAASIDVRLCNAGTVQVFFALGNSSVTVTAANGCPLVPGAAEVFSRRGATHIAAIVASGSAALYVTPGGGL